MKGEYSDGRIAALLRTTHVQAALCCALAVVVAPVDHATRVDAWRNHS
jgi:hypothetical protein